MLINCIYERKCIKHYNRERANSYHLGKYTSGHNCLPNYKNLLPELISRSEKYFNTKYFTAKSNL